MAINKQTVLRILYRNLSNGYRDIDGDWVEGSIDKRAIDEIEALPDIAETPIQILSEDDPRIGILI